MGLEVSCVIPIHINISKISKVEGIDLEDMPYLYCEYTNHKKKPLIKLNHPDSWLGKISPIKTPSFSEGMCLVDYIEIVKKEYKSSIRSIDLRKEFVSDLIKNYGSVIDYDSDLFLKANILVISSHFPINVMVNIPPMYPSENISFTFQGLIYTKKQLQRSEKVTVKYDTNKWNREMVIDALMTKVKDTIPIFVNHIKN